MHHSFIDKFSRGATFIHRLDPRAKLLFFVPLVVVISVTPEAWAPTLVGYAALLIAVALAARLPLAYLAKRLLLVLPFVLAVVVFLPFIREGREVAQVPLFGLELVVTREGLAAAGSVLAKALLSAFALMLLVSTTRFDHLLRALEDCRVPRSLVIILSFLYRYLYLLIEEAQSMKRAREARTVRRVRLRQPVPRPGLPAGIAAQLDETGRATRGTSAGVGLRPLPSLWSLRLKAAGGTVGVLFLRTYERAERAYQAMLARGFAGEVRTLTRFRFAARDFAALATGWAAVALLLGLGSLR
jgi:cobalt/nickel transport system permease protein